MGEAGPNSSLTACSSLRFPRRSYRRPGRCQRLLFVVVYKLERPNTKKNCGPWKSGNPKPGFPLSHRPECLRRKEKNGRLHKTVDAPEMGAVAHERTDSLARSVNAQMCSSVFSAPSARVSPTASALSAPPSPCAPQRLRASAVKKKFFLRVSVSLRQVTTRSSPQ